jgi:hypothetical protein
MVPLIRTIFAGIGVALRYAAPNAMMRLMQ